MSQLKDPSNENILDLLLKHPQFSHYQKVGADDWRDPTEKNAGLSLSSKGFKDHKSGESGSLASLAKKTGILYDLIEEVTKQNVVKVASSNKSPDNKAKANQLWVKAESDISRKQVITYLTEQRKIPLENFEDLLGKYLRSVSDWDGNPILLIPMLDSRQAQAAVNHNPFHVEKVQRIILKEDGREKMQLGGRDHVGRVTYFPPLSNKAESVQYLICEGLEDSLSLRSKYRDYRFLLTHGKANLKYIPEFLPKEAEVLIISDHDAHENPKENGEVAAAELRSALREKKHFTSVVALMPAKPKEDANAALQRGTLDEWNESLVGVPPPPNTLPSDFDIESIKGDIPTLPKGILPPELEEYLSLAAESLDLNYEAAFCEFLMNASVAVGGNKQLVIRADWLEKACIWLASIGKSGLGKTPLNRKCGGKLLEAQQLQWKLEADEEIKEWKRLVRKTEQGEEPPEKPVRKRWIANSLTLERLCALHEENSAGIGIISDEVRGVLEGLNQYKSKGNDKQKLLSLWNGHTFENPTAESDRYIPSVFVPISGGIQEDFVKKIINDENTTDGLAARFLFNHLLLSPEPASIERQDAISDLLEQSKGQATLQRVFDRLVSIRDERKQVLMNIYARDILALIGQNLKKEAREGDDQAFAAYAKLRTYIYRIALLLHYLFEPKPDETELSEETAQKTHIVMKFFIASMKRAYGTVSLNKKEMNARKIMNKVRELGGSSTLREVKQPLRKSMTSNEFDSILEILVKAEELKETREGKTTRVSFT